MNEELMSEDLEVVYGELVEQAGELALPNQIKQELAEAKSLADYRHLITKYDVARTAAQKAAGLLQAQGNPVEVVEATRETANQYAAAHLEAEAEAGRVLKAMSERGERYVWKGGNPTRAGETPGISKHTTRGEDAYEARIFIEDEDGKTRQRTARAKTLEEAEQKLQELKDKHAPQLKTVVQRQSLTDLGVDKNDATTWQRVGSIPDEVRSTYIEDAHDKGAEITTAGLLRFAREPREPKEDGRSTIEMGYDLIVKSLQDAIGYDPVVMAGQAINTGRKTKYVQLIQRTGEWIEASLDALGQ